MDRLIVRDGLVPEQYIDAALESTPPPDENGAWRRGSESGGGPHRVGRSGPTFHALPPKHESMDFMAAAIVNVVSRYYTNPQPDFTYAGIFQMLEGQSLSPHRDRTSIPRKPKLRRRLGVILFLNDPDGGHFQLWDEGGPTNDIEPVRNRLVLFDFNAYHAVSEVAPDSRRLTLSLHLASEVRPDEDPPHAKMTWLADDFPEVFAPE